MHLGKGLPSKLFHAKKSFATHRYSKQNSYDSTSGYRIFSTKMTNANLLKPILSRFFNLTTLKSCFKLTQTQIVDSRLKLICNTNEIISRQLSF